MVRSRFDVLREEKGLREARRLPLRVVKDETGVAVSTLHQLSSNQFKGVHNTTVEALCKYFGVGVGELLEYVPDEGKGEE